MRPLCTSPSLGLRVSQRTPSTADTLGALDMLGEDILIANVLPRCTEQGFLPGFSQANRRARRLSYQCALAHLHMGAESSVTLGSQVPALPESFWQTTREAQQFINRFVKPVAGFETSIKAWAEQESTHAHSDATEAARRLIAAHQTQDSKLDLSGLHLHSIPAEISQLVDLRTLDLSHNALAHISASVLTLDYLRELDVSDNVLRTLPERIDKLARLEQLFVFNNQITYLPQRFTQLHRLQLLQANHNKMQRLPPDLAHMRSLKSIMVAHNKLACLPVGIAHMTQLEGLWLEHNVLTDIEDAIAFLPKLRFIAIEGNAFESQPAAIERFIDARKPHAASTTAGASRSSTWFDWLLP